MPYITQIDRTRIDNGNPPETAGELNYAITRLVIAYWKLGDGRYQDINDIVGALEGAKQEFYRRVAIPYEDNKIKANGDIY